MKKIKIKTPAKINLTLDILGVTENFHDIKSLVASIDLFDEITIKERTDQKITLLCEGIPVDCVAVDNNAFKAAKLFIEKFKTNGVDIKIKKGIPVGGGLGGSSADIAGVLNGMESIYNTGKKLLPLAQSLGSDAGYMLDGGYAVITGRGEKVAHKNIDKALYLILITEQKGVSARSSYKGYDKIGKTYKPCTVAAEKALETNDFEKFISLVKNDLYYSSCQIVPEMSGNIYALKKAGAPCAIMTGSGSCVVGIFQDKKQRDASYKKLLPLFSDSLIKAQTIVK